MTHAGCCGKTSVFVKVSAFLFLFAFVLLLLGFGTPLWSTRGGQNEGLWERCTGSLCVSTLDDPLGDQVWFVAVQALVTIGLILGLAGVILSFIIMFDVACAHKKAIRIAAIVHAFAPAALLLCGVFVYWIRGEIYFAVFYLGFSWGITLSAAIVFVVAGILLSVDLDRIHNDHDEEAADMPEAHSEAASTPEHA
ncbi:uncharacterized protein [Haliotis cracherodii]|uniref:uncharacterized protein n=1 Tax=Haliotis cracherodii TaxID=6455 RepID=UPI0039EBC57F